MVELDLFTSCLLIFCAAVVYVDLLLGRGKREALRQRLISWRIKLKAMPLYQVPRGELEFASWPLSWLAGGVLYFAAIEKWPRLLRPVRNFIPFLVALLIGAVIGLGTAGIVALRSDNLSGFIPFVFSREFFVLCWAIAVGNVFVFLPSLLAIIWLNDRYPDGTLVALLQLATLFVSVFFAPLFGMLLLAMVATMFMLYLTLLAKLLGFGEISPIHLGESFSLPPLGSIPANTLAFWPSLGHEYGLATNSLLASSVLTWVRLGIAGVFLLSWLILPLTYRFAYLNLRSLLELEKPSLTAIAVATSSVAKLLQEAVKVVVKYFNAGQG
ncbi:hypothetical protein [Reyranella soli]|uniref:hypothetical protein n=1 Tax=Reyranella soli TaxID=1230389 RepID=UPI0011BF1B81|nr:hypothetical protein [Reyranella soli]